MTKETINKLTFKQFFRAHSPLLFIFYVDIILLVKKIVIVVSSFVEEEGITHLTFDQFPVKVNHLK